MIHTSILGRRLASSFLVPDKLKICFSCLARNFCNCCSSLNRWRSHLQCRNGLMNHNTSIISDCPTLHLPFPLFLLLLKLFMSFQQSLVGDVLSPRAVPRIERVGTLNSPWGLKTRIVIVIVKVANLIKIIYIPPWLCLSWYKACLEQLSCNGFYPLWSLEPGIE